MTETVTAFENNKLVAFDIENDFIISHNDIHFEGSPDQTQITVHAKYKGGNMFSRSLFVLMNSSVKKSQTENFLMLKEIIENNKCKQYCDLVIEPQKLAKFTNYDFGKAKEIFNIGYEGSKIALEKFAVKPQQLFRRLKVA